MPPVLTDVGLRGTVVIDAARKAGVYSDADGSGFDDVIERAAAGSGPRPRANSVPWTPGSPWSGAARPR